MSQARTEIHNLFSLPKFGSYLAASATVVELNRTLLCEAVKRLPLLRHVRHGDELNFSIFLVTPAEHDTWRAWVLSGDA